MKLWKKIGDTEFDLETVFSITELQSGPNPIYHVKLSNGDALQWSQQEKDLYDKEIEFHKKVLGMMGAIDTMKSSYVGRQP